MIGIGILPLPPLEDTARRQPSRNQKVGPHRTWNQPVPRSSILACQPPELQEIISVACKPPESAVAWDSSRTDQDRGHGAWGR